MLRFHLDENIEACVADGLRRRGLDTTTADEVGLRGAADEDHLAFGLSDGRVILTHDRDFLRLAARGISHAGIAYCPHGVRSIGEMIAGLALLSDRFGPEDFQQRVEFL